MTSLSTVSPPRVLPLLALGAMLSLTACGDDSSDPIDASTLLDAGSAIDASLDAGPWADASPSDASPPPDAGATDDAGTDAYGTIAGSCNVVAAELDEPTPSFFLVRFAFPGDGFDDPEERPLLTAGAQEILAEGTAGGSSGVSEAFAFEVLARCEGASLIKTETEIVYEPTTSKKTDILVAIDGTRVGVSVTRAMSYPAEAPYPLERAAFIEGKLHDILESTMNVVAADAWVKQIFVVVAMGDMHAESIRTVWEGFDAETRADTVLYVVITDGPVTESTA